MKVLQIFPFSFIGGPEKQFLSIAKELKKYDIQTDFLIYTNPSVSTAQIDRLKCLCKQNSTKLHIKSSPKIYSFIKESIDLKKLFKDEQYHGLIFSGYLPNLLSTMIPAKKICAYHGWTKSTLKVHLYEMLEVLSYSRFQAIVCVSSKQKEHLQRYNPACYQVNNSILIPCQTLEDKAPTASLNYGSRLTKVISIGRLSFEKGFDIALNAASILKKQDVDFIWDIYGDGIEYGKLNKMAEQLGLTDHVNFRGFTADPLGLLKNYDLFVLPSRTEGQSIALLEGLSKKIPAIVTKVGGNPDIIEDRKTGLIADPNPESIAEKMIWAINSKDKMIEMSEQAFENLKQNFSTEMQGKRWRDILQKHF